MGLTGALSTRTKRLEDILSTDGVLHVMPGSVDVARPVIARGFAEWTVNEDVIKYIDFLCDPPPLGQAYLLRMRNESATVDITAKIGTLAPVYDCVRGDKAGLAITVVAATDVITTASAHGLLVGDPVRFAETTGGFTVATTYYVRTVPSTTTLTISTRQTGGSVVDLTTVTAGQNTMYAVSSNSTALVGTPTAATDLFTTTVPHGFQIGDAIVFSAIGDTNVVIGTIYYVLTTAAEDIFTMSAAQGSGATVFNVTGTTACTFAIADEFFLLTELSVPKWVAGSSVLVRAGTRDVLISGFPGRSGKGRIYLAKSAATAAIFKFYAELTAV